MHDTDWSFPIQIMKEDTVSLALKKHDSTWRFLRTEIRGYEEGSRFIVVLRLGSTNGPIRYMSLAIFEYNSIIPKIYFDGKLNFDD